eukprot:TRINITY_DN2248_c0_g4_i1.p1 TRINITY_DN2248_c0_g4~~TRINITY_DN2248_c0_g4_i1.p1  ORF type:complete len:1366 (+),score=395.37 TRINITY_DN2248_c0_g4_i1:350-4447(+)
MQISSTFSAACHFDGEYLLTFGQTGIKSKKSKKFQPIAQRLNFKNGEYDWFKFPYDCNNSTCIEYNKRLYFFGGYNNIEKQTTNQIIEFDLDTRTYIFINLLGKLPPSRAYHTSVVYNNKMYVFGGKTITQSALSKELKDLWSYDIKKKKWKKLETKGEVPGSRRGHSAVIYKEKMYLFGGFNETRGYSNDLYEFDFKTSEWRFIESERMVQARAYHTAVVNKNFMFIFGGKLSESKFSNRLYCYCFDNDHWGEVKTHNRPPSSYMHSSFLYDDTLFVFGGKKKTIPSKCYIYSVDLSAHYHYLKENSFEEETGETPTKLKKNEGSSESRLSEIFRKASLTDFFSSELDNTEGSDDMYEKEKKKRESLMGSDIYDDIKIGDLSEIFDQRGDSDSSTSELDENDSPSIKEIKKRNSGEKLESIANNFSEKRNNKNVFEEDSDPEMDRDNLSSESDEKLLSKSNVPVRKYKDLAGHLGDSHLRDLRLKAILGKDKKRSSKSYSDGMILMEKILEPSNISQVDDKNEISKSKNRNDKHEYENDRREKDKIKRERNNRKEKEKNDIYKNEYDQKERERINRNDNEKGKSVNNMEEKRKSVNKIEEKRKSANNIEEKRKSVNNIEEKRKSVNNIENKRKSVNNVENKNKSKNNNVGTKEKRESSLLYDNSSEESPKLALKDIKWVNEFKENEYEVTAPMVEEKEIFKEKINTVGRGFIKKEKDQIENAWEYFLNYVVKVDSKKDAPSERKLYLSESKFSPNLENKRWRKFRKEITQKKISFLSNYKNSENLSDKRLVNWLSFFKKSIEEFDLEKENERIKQIIMESDLKLKRFEWCKLLVEMAKTPLWREQIVDCGGIVVLQDLATLLDSDMKTMWNYTVFKSVNQEDVKLKPGSVGKGGYGVVYEGELKIKSNNGETICNTVAVKKVSSFLDPQLLRRELVLLSMLSSPHIINFIGAYYKEENYYLVTDYANLGSLDKVYEKFKGKLFLCVKLEILIDVAKGIEYLHKHGIVHRDLKSANVLVTNLFDAFLCDFGISKCIKRDRKNTILGGTTPYYAPELICEMVPSDQLGYKKPTEVSVGGPQDMYAFGYVAWEIYHEALAYSNYSDNALRKMKFDDVTNKNNSPLPLDVQIPWINAIKSCWSFDPKMRMDSSQCLKNLLFLKTQLEQVIREDGNSRLISTDIPSREEKSRYLKRFFKNELSKRRVEKKAKRPSSAKIVPMKKDPSANKIKKIKNKRFPVQKKMSNSLEKPVSRNSPENNIRETRSSPNRDDNLNNNKSDIENQYLSIIKQIQLMFGIKIDETFPFSIARSNLVNLVDELKSFGWENFILILLPPKDFEKIVDILKQKLTIISFTAILSLNNWIYQKK